MATSLNRLSARAVQTLTKPGRHADGGNLYLSISSTGARSWLFIFRNAGKQREMGLGGVRGVPLAKARDLAAEARQALAAGLDPLAIKTQTHKIQTFGQAADRHIEAMEGSWRNQKHRDQWKSTLATYAKPIREIPIDAIETNHILGVLQPIWAEKPETASRLRGRLEAILDGAKAKGLRQGENPARWRGHLDHILPKPKKLARGHHAAMPYSDVPTFMSRLRAMPGIAAMGLELTILTAARSGETLGMRWAEIDLEAAVWTVPSARMKGGREHRVPLAPRVISILRAAEAFRTTGGYVFPGAKVERPLSNMAFEMTLRRMEVDVTTHGFRSSFRDWAGEETTYPREIAEAALAHLVGDDTERAYRRGDALQKRRSLMNDWAVFVGACNETA